MEQDTEHNGHALALVTARHEELNKRRFKVAYDRGVRDATIGWLAITIIVALAVRAF